MIAASKRFDRRILTEDDELEVALEVTQRVLVGRGNVLGRNAGDARDDVLDHLRRHNRLALAFRPEPQARAGLVNDVDRLVGQLPIIDVPCRQLGRSAERIIGVLDSMMLFETRAQTL